MARPGFFAVDSLASVHVLLVDEEPASREELIAILRYCGALVTVAESEVEGIRVLDNIKPDVIVIALPRRYRGEVVLVRILRARKPEDGGVVPIVVILGPGEQLDPSAGVTVQLNRPLDAWRICGALARLVSAQG